jgi:hypothetical protein
LQEFKLKNAKIKNRLRGEYFITVLDLSPEK